MPNTWQRERARRRAARAVIAKAGTIDLRTDELIVLSEEDVVRQAREDVAALIAPELRTAIEAYIGGDDDALPESREIDLTGPERRNAAARLERAS